MHAGGNRNARVHPRELVPAHCAATGKALLAWRQRWRDSILSQPLERHTERTLADPVTLARDADATRSRGYATENGEFTDDVRGVAAPVFIDGDAIAALGVSGPDVDALAGQVVMLAAKLTTALATHT